MSSKQRKPTGKMVARKISSSSMRSENWVTLKSTSRLGTASVKCTVKRGPNYAQLPLGRNRYTSNITFQSRDKFSLETTVITSGPFKGQSALVMVPVPKKTLPFLELPPEIRNMIYGLALTRADNDVKIEGKQKKTLRAVWINTKSKRHAVGGDISPDTNLLSVCKQMHVEAGTIFYSCNRFHLYNTSALYCFLDKIGILSKQIQRLTITEVTDNAFFPTRTNDVGKLLAKAKELQHIHINCAMIDAYNTNRLVDAFAPLLKMLSLRGLDKEGLFTVIDLRREGTLCTRHRTSYDHASKGCLACDKAKQSAVADMIGLKNDAYKSLKPQVGFGSDKYAATFNASEGEDSDDSRDSDDSDDSDSACSDSEDSDN